MEGWKASEENYVLRDPQQSLICQITSTAWQGEAGSQKCHVFMQWKRLCFELRGSLESDGRQLFSKIICGVDAGRKHMEAPEIHLGTRFELILL